MHPTVWPSGLRRWLQAPVRKGVGSNPTAVIFCRRRVLHAALLHVRWSCEEKQMTAVGFEPTQLALVELESTPLDHSGKLSTGGGGAGRPFSQNPKRATTPATQSFRKRTRKRETLQPSTGANAHVGTRARTKIAHSPRKTDRMHPSAPVRSNLMHA